jgi:hypothetical protein
METLLTTALACLCLPVFIPVIGKGIQHIQQREVILTRWLVFDLRVTHFEGAGALIYGGGQVIGGLVAILGALLAVSRADIALALAAGLAGALIIQLGGTLARYIQGGETDISVMEKMQRKHAAYWDDLERATSDDVIPGEAQPPRREDDSGDIYILGPGEYDTIERPPDPDDEDEDEDRRG